jgi:hypothetical protein
MSPFNAHLSKRGPNFPGQRRHSISQHNYEFAINELNIACIGRPLINTNLFTLSSEFWLSKLLFQL